MFQEPGSSGGEANLLGDLLRLAFGAQAAQAVYVAAKLGLADLLKDGPRATADLAAATDANAAALRRLLRSLVSLGVCTESAGDRFALAAMGEYLRTDRPDSVQPRVILNTEVLQPLWGELLHTVRTGEAGAARVLGMPLWEYLGAHPETGALFDRTMASYARYRVGPAVAAYDFDQFGTIVDVGGGNGALLIEILRTYPRPRGIVFDLPAVAERAEQHIAGADLAERCVAVGGSALETVPGGGDAYILCNFLINMNDEEAGAILRHCREAMAAGGRVLLVEPVMPAGGEPTDPYRSWDTTAIDLTMLSINGAGGWRVRTAEEFRTLLEASGLTLTAIIPTSSSVSLIEAHPERFLSN
jgi:O-methyltransferase/methyltransferase family protein